MLASNSHSFLYFCLDFDLFLYYLIFIVLPSDFLFQFSFYFDLIVRWCFIVSYPIVTLIFHCIFSWFFSSHFIFVYLISLLISQRILLCFPPSVFITCLSIFSRTLTYLFFSWFSSIPNRVLAWFLHPYFSFYIYPIPLYLFLNFIPILTHFSWQFYPTSCMKSFFVSL